MNRLLLPVVLLGVFFCQCSGKKSGQPRKPPKKPEEQSAKCQDVQTLIGRLRDKDVETRREAAKALDELGEKAKAAAPALIEALQDEDAEVRQIAAGALGEIGTDAEITRPALLKMTKDADEFVRTNVIWSLATLGLVKSDVELLSEAWKDDSPAVREMVQKALGAFEHHTPDTLMIVVAGLKDADPDVFNAAKDTLKELGAQVRPVLPDLRKIAVDKDEYVRAAVARALAAAGPDRKDLPVIYAACRDKSAMVRLQALEGLQAGAPADAALAGVALTAMRDEYYEIRQAAAGLLGRVRPVTKEVLAALIKALANDKSDDVRRACAAALGDIGPAAAPAVDALIKALDDEGTFVAGNAARALGSIGLVSPNVMPALIKAVRNRRTRWRAVQTLAELGPAAAPAIPALIEILEEGKKKNILAYDEAMRTLGNIGPEAAAAVPALIKAAGNCGAGTNERGYACQAIGKIGPAAKEAVDMLIEFLDDPEDGCGWVFVNAAGALGSIGPDARAAAPTLRKYFKNKAKYAEKFNSRWHAAGETLARIGFADEIVPIFIKDLSEKDSWKRECAVVSLGDIGPAAKQALPHLRKFFNDRSHKLHWVAGIALAKMGEADRVVPVLIEYLGSKDSEKRDNAIVCLMAIGPAARSAVPHLEKLRETSDGMVGARINGALYKITGRKYTWMILF